MKATGDGKQETSKSTEKGVRARCEAKPKRISGGVVARFAIIGLLWAGLCAWYVAHMVAAGTQVTLLTLFPLIASVIVVFVPLYKKYVRNDNKR